jgi:hypothetical protein
MNTPKKDDLRRELLEAVFDAVEESGRPREALRFRPRDWAEHRGYDVEAVGRASEWLRDRRLLTAAGLGGSHIITPAGQDEVERLRREAPKSEAAEVNIFLSADEMASLEPMVKAVEDYLHNHGDELDPDDADDIRAQLDTIRAQTRTKRPRRDVVAGAVKGLKWAADKAGGAALGAGTLALIQQALQLLG